MADKKEEEEPETDEYGLAIQKYEARVLVVLPDQGYGEQTLRYARSMLYNVHVGTYSVANDTEALLQGNLQDEFMVDGPLADAKLDDFAGVIFAGGPGATALADDPVARRLAQEASQQGKLLAAWGEATLILAKAGVVKGLKVTGHPSVAAALKSAGGKVRGNQVERDGTLVTGMDESSGMRFGRLLVQVVGIGV